MTHIKILDREDLPEGYDVLEVDCLELSTLRKFYETMAEKLEFPDYFGFNMDSFDEVMNDLSWIENEDILIYFTNSEYFLSQERSPRKIITLLDLLDATCEEWEWMESDEFTPKKNLKIYFSSSKRMDGFLSE